MDFSHGFLQEHNIQLHRAPSILYDNFSNRHKTKRMRKKTEFEGVDVNSFLITNMKRLGFTYIEAGPIMMQSLLHPDGEPNIDLFGVTMRMDNFQSNSLKYLAYFLLL